MDVQIVLPDFGYENEHFRIYELARSLSVQSVEIVENTSICDLIMSVGDFSCDMGLVNVLHNM